MALLASGILGHNIHISALMRIWCFRVTVAFLQMRIGREKSTHQSSTYAVMSIVGTN